MSMFRIGQSRLLSTILMALKKWWTSRKGYCDNMTTIMIIVEFIVIFALSILLVEFMRLYRKAQDTSSELQLDNISLTWENERLKEQIEWLENR